MLQIPQLSYYFLLSMDMTDTSKCTKRTASARHSALSLVTL